MKNQEEAMNIQNQNSRYKGHGAFGERIKKTNRKLYQLGTHQYNEGNINRRIQISLDKNQSNYATEAAKVQY